MKNKITKLFIKTVFSLTLFLSISGTAYALGEYTVLAPLPGVQNETTNQTSLETYIPSVFRLSIAIAAFLAFAAITFGGIMYATSDAITGKSQGKEIVTNAVWGLLLVVGAWVILNTINPRILNFTLSVEEIVTSTSTAPAVSVGCSGCVRTVGLPISPSSNSNVDASILPRLNALNTALQSANVPWVITEAYPPKVNHVAACHSTGTCIDARPVDRNNPTHINAFHNAAVSAGLRPVYEVATSDERLRLIRAGVTVPIIVVRGINASHFSVYSQ